MAPQSSRSLQADLVTLGGWCFLAGVFLMLTGDGLTNINQPMAAQAWPWLYLVPLAISVVLMVAAGGVRLRLPARASIVYAPLAALLAAFALSAIFSQERSLSLVSLGWLAAIALFWWFTAQVLEERWLADATGIVVAVAMLELAIRVIVFRLDEGLDQIPLWIDSVVWQGKLQITWVFNLFAPLLLARFIGDQRRWVAALNGAAWAAVGLANYTLLSRMGTMVFLLTTVAVCLVNLAHWRRWVVLMGTAAVGGAVVIANNLQITTFVASTLLDRSQNQGIDVRLRVWEEAWRLFVTHPIVGIGVGTFDEIVYQVPNSEANLDFRMHGWHAHNVPLHILTETGILGLAAWLFLWFVVLRALIRHWKSSDREQRLFSRVSLVSVLAFHLLSMTEVLIGARVHSSLQMNLTVALLVLLGLRMSLPAPSAESD
jgi:O-antigen ligase